MAALNLSTPHHRFAPAPDLEDFCPAPRLIDMPSVSNDQHVAASWRGKGQRLRLRFTEYPILPEPNRNRPFAQIAWIFSPYRVMEIH